MDVRAALLFGLGISVTYTAVLIGVSYGIWLLVVRSAGLAGTSLSGAGLVVWAYRRQYLLDTEIEAVDGVGRWDAAFIPLCLTGVVLVAYAFCSGLRAGRSWRPVRRARVQAS